MNYKAYESSSAQKRLYLVNQLVGTGTLYNETRAWIIHGNLEPNRLEEAVHRLSPRHESLRTCFVTDEGEVLQKVFDTVDCRFQYQRQPESTAVETMLENFIRPFDLHRVPMWQIKLVQWGEQRQVLLFDFHHIICDGTSMELIIGDLTQLYLGRELPEPDVQYVDFTMWQNDLFQDDHIKKQEQYWLEVFKGDIPVLEMPTDFPRAQGVESTGLSLEFRVDETVTAGLNQLAVDNRSTLFVVLLSVYYVLLSRYTQQEDIVAGIPIAGRTHAEFESIVGMFVNSLALRNRPRRELNFSDFLSEVSRNTFSAFENQDYPFEMLVEKVAPGRQVNRNPLFDTMFALQNFSRAMSVADKDGEKFSIEPYRIKSGTAKFDLTFQAFETDRGVEFFLEYRSSLFQHETMERFTRHFANICREVAADSRLPLGEIQVISTEERGYLLETLNRTATPYPLNKSIPQLFEEQVEKYPHRMAVVCGARHLTYAQLDRRADLLAAVLGKKNGCAGHIVALMAERSLEMLVGIIGILKAGAAYLPLNPQFPPSRCIAMMEDCGVPLLLTGSGMTEDNLYTQWLGNGHGARDPGQREILFFESLPTSADDLEPPAPPPVHQPEALAYVIFTSGSTGKPKGSLTTHQNVIRVVRDTNYISFEPGDAVLQLSNYAFDGSVFDIFGALLNGARLVLFQGGRAGGLDRLPGIIAREKITVFFITTALFNALVDLDIESLKYTRKILFGGERASGLHARKAVEHLGGGRIMNVYGPTETTVYATYFPLDDAPGTAGEVPIGGPIANTYVYILDPGLRLVPPGGYGELYIGGDGVCAGYLNNPQLTAERFIPNPFVKGDRLYKTGDTVRMQASGHIEFVDRIDNQLKIRGFRIEPGEIENRLISLPGVGEAVVVGIDSNTGEKDLCAYLVPEGQKSLDLEDIKESLLRQLPDFMIPAFFIPLEELPLTPNGKVDKKALPRPGAAAGTAFVAPRDEVEKKMALLWAGILGMKEEQLGIDTNFFQAGGHSIKATRLAAAIQKELNVRLPLVDIFTLPTIRQMAGAVKKAAAETYISIPIAGEEEYYPLSPPQKRLYILQQMDACSTVYNMPMFVPLDENVQLERVEEIFNRLIRRHESFRTSFHILDEEPVQKVHQQAPFSIDYYRNPGDLVSGPGSSGEPRDSFHAFVRPFDLGLAPLLRAGLLPWKEGRYVLMIDMHHIISDGVSQEVLREEFNALYAGRPLEPVKIRYRDYACWINSPGQRQRMEKQENYWLNRFKGEIPVLNLPLDFSRPTVQSFEGGTVDFTFEAKTLARLRHLADTHDVTLYMLLVALFNILLAKVSGQEDMVVGTPVAARRHADLEGIIGMFVNTLALRNRVDAQQSFPHFLSRLKQHTLESFDNQEYPFEELVEKVLVQRDAGRNPVFDVMFGLNSTQLEEAPQTDTEIPGTGVAISKFDLMLTGMEGKSFLAFTLEYCTRLFRENTAYRFTRIFKLITRHVLDHPGSSIGRIPIVTEEEKERLLLDFNDTAVSYTGEKTVHRCFERQAALVPGRTALVSLEETRPGSAAGIWNPGRLTYSGVEECSRLLAMRLRQAGLRTGEIVALRLDRSVAMVVAVLGILRAGGAYLPIDPGYPDERVSYILADSAARIMVTGGEEPYRPRPESGEVRGNNRIEIIDMSRLDKLDGAGPGLEDISGVDRLEDFSPAAETSPAYVIYTSGSTGKPKGVIVEHSAAVNLLNALADRYPLEAEDAYLLKTPYIFDVSVSELFGWFMRGGRLVTGGKDFHRDPNQILEAVHGAGITHINFVPSMFNVFLQVLDTENVEKLASLKYIFLAGEALPPAQVRAFRQLNQTVRLENLYGPTEAAVYATWYALTHMDEGGTVPIGTPLPNVNIFMMDKAGGLLPIGIPGELCIAGTGLARGYLNRPELTAQRFVSPLSKTPLPSPLYKTGDLARWLPNGNIEFLGRIDHQVKIRGFRIELGEIEAVLLMHPDIRETVVVDRSDSRGDRYLCAYILHRQEGQGPDSGEIREYLSRKLPEYMTPAYFVFPDQLPLTPSGKIARNRLPEPGAPGHTSTSVPPRNSVEKQLLDIWREVLPLSPGVPGIDDNFFHLGGHSLKATVMISRIHKLFKVSMPLAEVFKTPTIRGLAAAIDAASPREHAAVEPAEEKEYYALSSAQERIYALQQMDRDSTVYNISGLYPLRVDLPKDRLDTIFKELCRRHESFRTCFGVVEGEPVQFIREQVEFDVRYIEGAGDDIPGIFKRFIRPFDLARPPLLRVGIVTPPTGESLLLIDIHHIVADGFSFTRLREEFLLMASGNRLPALSLQYKDYAEWQQRSWWAGRLASQEEYWLGLLAADVPVLDLPTDFDRPPVRNYAGDMLFTRLSGEDANLLFQYARKENVTMFMLLLSVNVIFLSRLGGQEDIVVGIPVSGRTHADLHGIIGMMVNTIVIRSFPRGETTFDAFLAEIKAAALEAFDNQDYPLEKLVEKLGKKRFSSHNPLFDTVFNFETGDGPGGAGESDAGAGQPPGSAGTAEPDEPVYTPATAKFDLALYARQWDGNLGFSIEYSTQLFTGETVERFALYLQEIISTVLKNPHIQLKDIRLPHHFSTVQSHMPEEDEGDFDF